MVNCKQHWMLNTSILSLIVRCSLPLLPAIFLLSAYDVFETRLIAQICSTQLSALSYSTSITTGMMGIAIALSIATNNWICRLKSSVNQHSCSAEKNELLSNIVRALVITSAITFCLMIFLYLFSSNFYQFIGLKSSLHVTSILPLVTEYTEIRLMSWIPLVLIWQINGILRSLGHIKQASFLLTAWMATKFLVSYVLIGDGQCGQLFNGGLIGAGYSHLFVDFLYSAFSLMVIYRYLGMSKHRLKAIKWRDTFNNIAFTGFNAGLQQFYFPLCIALLTFYLASIDASKVALLGIIFRVEALGLLIPVVFTAALPGLIAANWWAGNLQRVRRLVFQSFLMITIWQMLLSIIFYVNADYIAREFSQNTDLQVNIKYYLVLVPISFIGAGWAMLATSFLNAIGRSVSASILGFTHRVLLMLTSTIVGGWFLGIHGIFAGIAVAHFLSLFIACFLLIKAFGQQKGKIRYSEDKVGISQWQ